MNKIERKLWEEENLKEIRDLGHESGRWTGMKVLLTLFLLGVAVHFAVRPWPPSMHEATARGPMTKATVTQPAASQAGRMDRLTARLAREGDAQTEQTADDPPAARF